MALATNQQTQYNQLLSAGASPESAMQAALLVPTGQTTTTAPIGTSGSTSLGATQPIATSPMTTAPTQPTPSAPTALATPQATTTQTAQPTASPQLAMPASGSVVDLLNTAGQDSSFAARTQLAQQYGMQGYTGTATQNQELSKKFLDAFNNLKGTATPQSGAAASSALDQYLQDNQQVEQQDPTKSFMDAFAGMNPIEANIFQQLSTALATPVNQQSLTEFYQQEVAAQGIPGINMELADINRIMDGTEDDIRDEISNAGGFVTESQVQALSTARNKNLLKKANYLTNVLQAKNDYVDRIVSLTQADREQVSKDFDRKMGIAKTLFDMSQQMTNAARENYQSMINNIGYDGLVGSIKSPAEFKSVAKSLGMSPQMLLQLGQQKTTTQRKAELEELNFQLSMDKFEEDKRQFGLQHALEQQKVANQVAANTVISPYQAERVDRNLLSIDELLPRVTGGVVGLGSYAGAIRGTDAYNFAKDVDTLKANIAFTELTAMREASKTGGALGSIAVRELELLEATLGSLDVGQSSAQFSKNLQKIKDSIYSWNAQAMSLGKGYDYEGMKKEGYSDVEIYNALK